MRRLIVLATAVLLAGCLSNADKKPVDTTGVNPVQLGPAFHKPVKVTAGNTEPGVLLDAAGTVWVHAPGGLWKSNPDATAFAKVNFGTGRVFGGDAELAFGHDSLKDIYYSDLEELAAISVFSSHDGGKIWFEHPIASDSTLDDRQWLAVGPGTGPLGAGKETVYLAYNELASGVWVTASTDGGTTWAPHLAFAQSGATEADIQTMGNVVVDGQGRIALALTLGSAGAPVTPPVTGQYKVLVLTSDNGGLTWTPHTVRASPKNVANLFPTIAVDPAGTLYVAWSEDTDQGDDVYLSRSKDNGTSWSTPAKLNRGGTSGVMPWVSAGNEPGEVALEWYEANETKVSGDVAGEWIVRTLAAADANQDATHWRTEQLSPGPVHKGAVCVYGIACTTGRDLGDFLEVRVGPDDRLHGVYVNTLDSGDPIYYQGATRPWTEFPLV